MRQCAPHTRTLTPPPLQERRVSFARSPLLFAAAQDDANECTLLARLAAYLHANTTPVFSYCEMHVASVRFASQTYLSFASFVFQFARSVHTIQKFARTSKRGTTLVRRCCDELRRWVRIGLSDFTVLPRASSSHYFRQTICSGTRKKKKIVRYLP